MQNSSPGLPTVIVPDTVAALFQFPCSADLKAAAAAFPGALHATTVRGWTATEPVGSVWAQEWREFRPVAEGIFARLEISPGVVKFRRINDAAHDRTIARRKSVCAIKRAEVRLWERPLRESQAALLEELESEEHQLRLDASRGIIRRWSDKSRNNLRLAISQLDLADELKAGAPAMVTFTLPNSWLAITPTAAAAAAVWNRFGTWWEDEFGSRMRCIWKREFQDRGAPHWHTWMVLPEQTADYEHGTEQWRFELRRRIAEGWTKALQIPTPNRYDYEMNLCHGVNVSYTEGARARDPRRLATYFLKESAARSKDYQNLPPREWAGQAVGRFWGIRGFERAIELVHLDPRTAHRLWRVMKRVRESRHAAWGVRKKLRSRAGFVLVHDGAAFARQLAAYVDLYSGTDGGGQHELFALSSGSFRVGNLPQSSDRAAANFAAYRARSIATLEVAQLEEMFERSASPALAENRTYVPPPPDDN